MTLRLKVRPQVECKIYAGDDFELTIEAVDAAGDPVDLSGASVTVALHAWAGATWTGPALVTKATGGQGVELQAEPGVILVTLTEVDTKPLSSGTYYLVARVTTALDDSGTLEPFLAVVERTPLTPA